MLGQILGSVCPGEYSHISLRADSLHDVTSTGRSDTPGISRPPRLSGYRAAASACVEDRLANEKLPTPPRVPVSFRLLGPLSATPLDSLLHREKCAAHLTLELKRVQISSDVFGSICLSRPGVLGNL
jgi:hypothetical protein